MRTLPAPTGTRDLVGVAVWSAYASAAIGAIGAVLLIIFFVVGQPYGTLNDIAVVAQYLLAVPFLIALHTVFSPRAPRLSVLATTTGVIGIFAVVILQLLVIPLPVIGKVLTFAQQGLPVSVALLVGIGGWILLVGYMGHVTKAWRNSIPLALLGWSYFGYPIWAAAVGQHLKSSTRA